MTDGTDDNIMKDTTNSEQDADKPESIKDRIRGDMVVEIPDDSDFLDAIGGAVEIVRGSWKLKLTDAIKERDDQEQVFTYLLAAYAANIVSDGKRPPTVSRQELIDVFGEEIANDVAWHGWVKTYDGYAEIRPDCLRHATEELAARYGNADD